MILISGCGSDFVNNSNDEKNTVKATQKQSVSKPTVWAKGQQHEMLTVFNDVQSSNDFSPLYAGCRMEKMSNGGDKLIVYVTDRFLLLTNAEKQLYLEQNFKLWSIMAGAIKIKINYDFFEIEMLRKGTIKRLATWDSLFGVSIK